ncbi:MAG: DNA mismatch endonuclease Vsr [Alphaproteobacteria bacterium]|nr:DNA mismatch endonuclease Vsr [Alphaproteobacteria bacterium]
MADVVSREKRSEMMSGIRGKDTRPEITIRRALHAAGYRYRLHGAKLPGKPDLVLPKYRAVIFVHGCFWHKHDCHLFKMPSTRQEFWRTKIQGNVRRDEKVLEALHGEGWRTLIVWECALKGKHKLPEEDLIERISSWIRSSETQDEIRGAG